MENSPNKADANGKETPRQNDLPPNRNASNFEQREKVLKELLKQTHTTLDQCYQESKKLNNKFDLYNGNYALRFSIEIYSFPFVQFNQLNDICVVVFCCRSAALR